MSKKTAIENLLKGIDLLDPSGRNRKLYENLFKSMNNEEFNEWVDKLKNGIFMISIIIPNGDTKTKVTRDRLKQIRKKLGINIFEEVIFTDTENNRFSPPHKYNILLLPVSRMAQHQITKIGIAKNNYKRNAMTDQVTGESKANSLTLPETYIYSGLGMKTLLDEVLSIRGGDRRALMVMESELIEKGEVSLKELDNVRTKASAVKRLKNYFKAMHENINM